MSTKWGNIPDWVYSSAQALMQSLKAVDPVTYEHCCRVGEMSRKLARDSGLNEYEQKLCEFAGLFHDIGKIGIPQEIIHKPGKLDNAEYLRMKDHPIISEQIIQPFTHYEFFKNLIPGVRGHHERVDGQGYPDKLLGDEVPLIARVILVVDTYDAMSQDRAYRKGLPDEVVYEELHRYAGLQFDAQLVKIFLAAHPHWKSQERDQETFHHIIKQVA